MASSCAPRPENYSGRIGRSTAVLTGNNQGNVANCPPLQSAVHDVKNLVAAA